MTAGFLSRVDAIGAVEEVTERALAALGVAADAQAAED